MNEIRPMMAPVWTPAPQAQAPVGQAPPPPPVGDQFMFAPAPADKFRELARQRLEAMGANPESPSLVELTALQLAEQKYTEQSVGFPAPVPAPNTPVKGMLLQANYLNALAASQLGCHPALAPVFLTVLSDLDPFKIYGPRMQNGNNAWIVAGASLENQIAASQAAGAQAKVHGILVTGICDPGEHDRVSRAISPLIDQIGQDRLQKLVKTVHIQTQLGEMLNGDGANMGGLGGGGLVGLSRSSVLNADQLRRNLAHEVGHLVDDELGQRVGYSKISDAPHSPFGKGASPNAFISDYAGRNASEDFAETHADLMEHWNQYKRFPEIAMLARGEYGQKLAFIAREGYGWQIPPMSQNMQKVLGDVSSGQTPFGYFDDKGQVVDALPHFQRVLKVMMDCTTADGQLKPEYFNVSGPERVRREWALNAVSGKPYEPAKTVSVHGLTRDLIDMLQRHPQDPQKGQSGAQVLARLERGGAPFYDACKRFFAQHYKPEEARSLEQGLNQYVGVAQPHWVSSSIH